MNKELNNKTKSMTLTTKDFDRVTLLIAGTGTMTIDWGDGTYEHHTLLAFDEKEWNENLDKYENKNKVLT